MLVTTLNSGKAPRRLPDVCNPVGTTRLSARRDSVLITDDRITTLGGTEGDEGG